MTDAEQRLLTRFGEVTIGALSRAIARPGVDIWSRQIPRDGALMVGAPVHVHLAALASHEFYR